MQELSQEGVQKVLFSIPRTLRGLRKRERLMVPDTRETLKLLHEK